MVNDWWHFLSSFTLFHKFMYRCLEISFYFYSSLSRLFVGVERKAPRAWIAELNGDFILFNRFLGACPYRNMP